MPDGWYICGVDGCLVAPYDPICPACAFRLVGAHLEHEKDES